MVIRYDIYTKEGDSAELNPHEEGEWVHYTSYEESRTSLISALNEVQHQRDAYKKQIEDLMAMVYQTSGIE